MIVIKDVCKSFRDKLVLNKVSFHIKPNECVGIIGLNGAGKTTLLNVMAGLIKNDSGFMRVHNNENVLKDYEALKDIVYVSGTRSLLWADLNIKSSYDNCIRMYGIPKATAKERLCELVDIFDIHKLLDLLPRNMSLGERMRCELVYAMLIRPKLLMLDETMIGLDVSVKHKIMQYMSSLKAEGTTIVYTSHNLLEVERLCDRVILLDKGKILYDGSIDRLLIKYAPLYTLSVKIKGNVPDMEDLPIEQFSIINDKMNNTELIEIYYHKQKIETKQVINHLLNRCNIVDMKLIEPNLEDTIKKMYKDKRE